MSKLKHALNDEGFRLKGSKESVEHFKMLCAPKIKMTKTLPTEGGWYYYAGFKECQPVPVFVDRELQREGNIINGRAQMISAASTGGYWSKVDQSMFEFEDKTDE